MVNIKRVNIISTDDWVWLFIDDKIYSEGHSFDSLGSGEDLFLLKLSEEKRFTSKDIECFYLEEDEEMLLDIHRLSFSEVLQKYGKYLKKIITKTINHAQ